MVQCRALIENNETVTTEIGCMQKMCPFWGFGRERRRYEKKLIKNAGKL